MSAKNLQTFKPSNLQTFKPSNLQTFKPYKALIALLVALALCFCAACSSESDPDPAYCGTWTPTSDLITYLNEALEAAMSNAGQTQTSLQAVALNDNGSGDSNGNESSIKLSADTLSLTISSDGTVTVSAMGYITIPGTYTYEGSDSSGTFEFTLNYSSLSSYGNTIVGIAQAIGSAFTGDGKSVTYTTGELSVTLNENDSKATVIFTK